MAAHAQALVADFGGGVMAGVEQYAHALPCLYSYQQMKHPLCSHQGQPKLGQRQPMARQAALPRWRRHPQGSIASFSGFAVRLSYFQSFLSRNKLHCALLGEMAKGSLSLRADGACKASCAAHRRRAKQ